LSKRITTGARRNTGVRTKQGVIKSGKVDVLVLSDR